MMRSHHSSFGACFRVLLTSLAANNILPFRIGDFMRIFAYAPDVNAPSSSVFSTVILERLLDIFMLFSFLTAGLWGLQGDANPASFHGHSLSAHVVAGIATLAALGLGMLLFGAPLLQRLTEKLVTRYGSHPRTRKISEWALPLFDAVAHLSFLARVWLLVLSAVVWACESMIFVATAAALGLVSGPRGPFLAAVLSNLSFLVPSAPGGVGPFEITAKQAMVSQGVDAGGAAVYALLVHIIVFFAVTGVGGIAFLLHRKERGSLTKPIADDLATLPSEIPTH
jgi:glycosyltransferase 2 family protein